MEFDLQDRLNQIAAENP